MLLYGWYYAVSQVVLADGLLNFGFHIFYSYIVAEDSGLELENPEELHVLGHVVVVLRVDDFHDALVVVGVRAVPDFRVLGPLVHLLLEPFVLADVVFADFFDLVIPLGFGLCDLDVGRLPPPGP